MKRFLPDVDALLALLDPLHVHHDAAHRWLERRSSLRLVTCSHAENGVMRVTSQPKYPNNLGTAGRVRQIMQDFIRETSAEACENEISLLTPEVLLRPDFLTPARVTDLYLLALAASNHAILATFDQRIPAEAVAGGKKALEIIPMS